MGILEIVSSIILVLTAIILVIVVLAQHGKSAYLGGAIAGGAAESVLGKSKAKTIDATLGRFTKVVAVIFVALTLFVNIASVVLKH